MGSFASVRNESCPAAILPFCALVSGDGGGGGGRLKKCCSRVSFDRLGSGVAVGIRAIGDLGPLFSE